MNLEGVISNDKLEINVFLRFEEPDPSLVLLTNHT